MKEGEVRCVDESGRSNCCFETASSSVRTKVQNMISKEIDLKMQDFVSQLGQHCSKIKKKTK